MSFLEGKKTYITMAVIIVLSAIGGWNDYCSNLLEAPSYCININVPTWLFTLLGTLGIYTRSAVKPK